ncbi:hypothetical protein pah_c016o101 [Parachlamydia acanthamoebae str. Hall's coccus]|nr:hypothetical protein pah_c016o101 [Parachlamydia acanthamoebae str. Hall's coccus]
MHKNAFTRINRKKGTYEQHFMLFAFSENGSLKKSCVFENPNFP